jgi:hypothetical protein
LTFNETGKTKDAINGATYLFLVSTFVTMQAFAEWKKYKIKSTSASNDLQLTVGGVVRKTGFINIFDKGSTIIDVTILEERGSGFCEGSI